MSPLIDLIRIELLHNLALLIAVTVLSGMVGRRWDGHYYGGIWQGVLFGAAALVTMMTPMQFAAGIQFDARSVAISIGGAFFGPSAALIAGGMAAVCRIALGGGGAPTGVFVIVAATVWGVLFHRGLRTAGGLDALLRLWIMGITLHALMLVLMFTLPGGFAWQVLPEIAPSIMIFYPLATVLLGAILADQRARREDLNRLRESEDRFALFLENAPAAIAMLDTQMCYLAASKRWYADYGLGDQEIIGRSHYEIFPEIADDWKAIHQRCLAGESEAREEDAFQRVDGRTEWLRWAIKPWRRASGEVGGIVMFTESITERKEAAQSLIDSERRFRSVFDQQFQFMGILSPEGTILELNDLPLRVVGAQKAEVIGLPFHEAPWWRGLPDVQEKLPQLLAKARDRGGVQIVELPFHDRTGAIRLSDNAITAVCGDDGVLAYFIVQGSDVTEKVRAREELVTANQLLESTFESLSDAVLVIETAARTVVRCNAAVSQVLGHPPEALLGRNTRLLYESDADYAAVGRAARHALEQGNTYRDEVVLCRADGTRIEAEITVNAIYHDRNWRTGVVALIRDITARKESERALSRMAERQTTILESITDAFYTLDHDWRFTYLNSEAERLLQCPRQALIGKVAGEVFSEATGSDIQAHLARALDTHATVHFESYYAPFGQWFEVHAYPSEEGLAVYFRDISERVRAEKELRDVSKRLQDVLDFSPLLITEVDTEGRYLLANAAAAALLQRDASDLVGRRIHEVLPDDAGRFMERLETVQRTGAPLLTEDTLYLPEARTYATTLFPMMDDGGRVVSIGGIAQDITDQKAAETERNRMESQLLQAQRMEAVGRLAGGVAHDFNNMLGVILGHTEMALLALPQDDFLRRELEEIQQAATRSADLTRQLLAFARRQAIAPRALDLNESVEKLMSMLARLVGENIEVEWRPGDAVPRILADPTQIDQVLANLTVNARDAIAGHGHMRIETAAASFDVAYCTHNPDHVPGDYAMLAVSDDGCGMDEATVSQVFEPFFTTKAIGGGTGLGLATVYGIVQQNKGFLTVRSTPGRGSTFRIYFPVHAEGGAALAPALDRARAPHGAETVLLVEDEAALLNLSRRVLERLGYTVLAAATPREALTLATSYEGAIHLLITDVIMPEMNGRELWKQLLALLPGLRTLFISGYTADVIGRHGAIEEEVHFLQKPFKIDQLATRVREILDGAAPAPPP